MMKRKQLEVDNEIQALQPKVNLQRGVFSKITQKYNKYSQTQIERLQQDLQKQSQSSFIQSPKNNEISLNIQKVKKYDKEESPSQQQFSSQMKAYPNSDSKLEFDQNFKYNASFSPSKRYQSNSYNKNYFQLSAIAPRDFDDQQNTLTTFFNPLEEEENQQALQEQIGSNQRVSMQELLFQLEELNQSSCDRSQILEDIREQINSEQKKLQQLEEEYASLKAKNDITIKGDEQQNKVALKKLQIMQLQVEQKEQSEQEEIELRVKINDEFEYINEQIRFLEAENMLEIESVQEEITKEKQKQAQMVKQLEKINNAIEEKRSYSVHEEIDEQTLIENKSEELKELGQRRVKIIANLSEMQESYNKLEQKYELQTDIIQGEIELEQNEYDITITEQNILIQQLVREIKILSELLSNPSEEDFNLISQNIFNFTPQLSNKQSNDLGFEEDGLD